MIKLDSLKTIEKLHLDGMLSFASSRLFTVDKKFKYNKKVKVGWIDYEYKDDENLYEIDFTTSKRILILGSTGTGKSFLARGIMNRAFWGGIVPIIITDCAPEYFSSSMPLQEKYKKFLLTDESSKPLPMQVYHPYFLQRDHLDYEIHGGQKLFQLRLSDISPYDITAFVNYNEMGLGAKQEIQAIVAELLKTNNKLKSMDDLIKFVEKRDINKVTKASIIQAFENLKNLAIFGDDVEQIDLISNINSKIVSDINLFGWSSGDMNRYVSLYMTILLRTIKDAKNMGKIPMNQPIVLLFEELHKFAPSKNSTNANDLFKKAIVSAIKELRKFGVSFILATQSADDIDSSLVEQCDIFLIPRGYNSSKVGSIALEKIPAIYTTRYDFLEAIRSKLGELREYKSKARDWLVIDSSRTDLERVAPLAPLSFHLSEDDKL